MIEFIKVQIADYANIFILTYKNFILIKKENLGEV